MAEPGRDIFGAAVLCASPDLRLIIAVKIILLMLHGVISFLQKISTRPIDRERRTTPRPKKSVAQNDAIRWLAIQTEQTGLTQHHTGLGNFATAAIFGLPSRPQKERW